MLWRHSIRRRATASRTTQMSQEDQVRLILALLGSGLVFLAQPAASQTYPVKPIHLLVPYAPGGPADIAARLVGAKLTEAWGQQVVVENRPGGNGFIAMAAAAKSAPDGYTLVMATIGEAAVSPVLFKEVPYNIERDFAPISLISDATIVLGTHGEAPFKSVADVIAAAKPSPAASRSALPATALSIRSCSSGWRSTPARSSSTFPTRAAHRPPMRLPPTRFRSACWQAHRSPRTSRPGASAFWPSRRPGGQGLVLIGQPCKKRVWRK